MKHTQRLLAVAIALALALTLALPAMAAVNWNGFYVITDLPENLYVLRDESFTLSVEVSTPDGVEVKYQWYTSQGTPISGATAPTLQLSSDDEYYPKAGNPHSQIVEAGSWQSFFYCKVTVLDGNGNQLTQWASNAVEVRVQGAFGEWLYSVTVRPLKGVAGWLWSAFLGLVSVPIRIFDFIALMLSMIFSGNRLPG